jgi:uncharacterized protein (DUF983 family)
MNIKLLTIALFGVCMIGFAAASFLLGIDLDMEDPFWISVDVGMCVTILMVLTYDSRYYKN